MLRRPSRHTCATSTPRVGPVDMMLKVRREDAFGLPLHLGRVRGAIAITRLDVRRDDTASGHRLEGAEYRIVNHDTGAQASVERGEIWIPRAWSDARLLLLHFRYKAATQTAMGDEGAIRERRMGHVGPDGASRVWTATKMIIRSGFNVYRAEVETAIKSVSGVERSAVVGGKGSDGDEEVVA